MDGERWRQVKELFNAAITYPPNERAAFLARSCDGDDDLRRQAERLIGAHEKSGDFIEAPVFQAAPELVRDDPDALLGQRLDHYRVESVLGIGGMGVVYLAIDERLGRKVGLKLVPRSVLANPNQLERLKREARAASALNHPNIVTIHEIGQADSTHYIAAEYIDGITLRERMSQASIAPNEALEIALQVASALCVAHQAGIVHRDIKPENIMLRRDGYVKILDFGIAQFTPQSAADPSAQAELQLLTQHGVILGTTRYMSPEQARGQAVDARSDIWSLGVVLYEMLSGAAPFEGATATDVMAGVLLTEPQPLDVGHAGIPAPMQRIVAKALRKDPAERFQTAAELLEELRTAKETKLPAETQPRSSRQRLLRVAAVILLVGLAAAAVLWSMRQRRAAIARAGAIAQFNAPSGVAVDSSGAVFVADIFDHTVRQITPAGDVRTLAGAAGTSGKSDGPGTRAQFNRPADLAADDAGNIYVADTDNHTIRKITPDGVASTLAGLAGVPGSEDGRGNGAKFKFPTGVAVDKAGNVYVADYLNNTLRKITPAGVVSTIAGVAGAAGNIDGPDGAARLNAPHDVAVDANGILYVADFGNHTIRRITPAGEVSTIAGFAGEKGSTDGNGATARFDGPYSVTLDGAGNLYVADTSNHTIRKISPGGDVSTVAGEAGAVGSADGTASEARFNAPTAVAVDGAMNVYVADYGNHTVRKITPAGVVTTIAGVAASDGDHTRR